MRRSQFIQRAALALLLGGGLLSCSGMGTYAPAGPGIAATPTMFPSDLPPDDARVELYAQQILAQQEQQAINATLAAVYAQQTATAEAHAVTATAEARAATATVAAQRATATAAAWQATVAAGHAQGTATAQAQAAHATDTAQAYQVQATATAESAATATARAEAAARATATVAAFYFEATATAVAGQQSAEAILRGEQLRREQLATRRAEIIYPVRAYGPWLILAALVTLLIYGGYRMVRAVEQRVRVVKLLGNEREIILQDDAVIQPARHTSGYLDYASYRHLPPPPPEDQRETTRRAQLVEGLRALHSTSGGSGSALSERQAQALQRLSQPGAPNLSGPVRIVEAREVRGWLQDVTPQALRNVLTVSREELPILDAEIREVSDDHDAH